MALLLMARMAARLLAASEALPLVATRTATGTWRMVTAVDGECGVDRAITERAIDLLCLNVQ